jgi:DNA-binding SARP family transcriptional activator
MDTGGSGLRVNCLGRLEITLDGRLLELPGTRAVAALTRLALSAGTPVGGTDLMTAIWDEDLPDDPRAGLHTVMARLRRLVGADRVVTEPTGYKLVIDPDRVDAIRFNRLLDTATAAGSGEAAVLDEALGLWRGRPFADAGSSWLTRFEAPRYAERRLAAVERRADLALAEGNEAAQLPRLLELATENPLRESLWSRLLLVLDASGRSAEALERYEEIRRRIADELGGDPGPQLQEVYRRLLVRTPAAAGPLVPPQPPVVVPRQLPGSSAPLVGRKRALKILDGLAVRDAGPRIAVIMGTPGAGKTALAIHWSHQVADRFPDGQLAVNLRGFDPTGVPATTDEVIHGFLDALQVRPESRPRGIEAQAALYRSLVADRRFLIVLDNARDADQVRPLLPGTPSCVVVVTSRRQLDGLIAAGAEPVVLDRLSTDGARLLLISRLGAERVAREPAAADEITALCSGLPLALTLAAARGAIHRDLELSEIAAGLRDAGTRLGELSGGDSLTDVRSVFSWSYNALTPEAARLFRLLGAHTGPDISVAATAALLGVSADEAPPVLRDLLRAHLVEETGPGRFGFHDLLRAYAVELSTADPDQQASDRVIDHYLVTAYAAGRQIAPHQQFTITPRTPDVEAEPIADKEQAFGWFDAERQVLITALKNAAGRPEEADRVWQLVGAMSAYLDLGGHWPEYYDVAKIGLTAAEQCEDLVAEELTLRWMAWAAGRLDRQDECLVLSQRGIDCAHRLGDTRAEALQTMTLSATYHQTEQPEESLRVSRRALELYRSIGDDRGMAQSLNGMGWVEAQLGQLEEAQVHCQEALERLERVGDEWRMAATLDSLGHIAARLGRSEVAIERYQRSAELYARCGDRSFGAATRNRLGDVLATVGRSEEARVEWAQALDVLSSLGDPRADEIREKLSAA